MGLQERQALADNVAIRLLTKTYDELARLQDDEARADAFLTELGFDIRSAPYISLTVGRAGHLRRRMCVEITVIDDPTDSRGQPGCIYFEKYSSGKLLVYGFR